MGRFEVDIMVQEKRESKKSAGGRNANANAVCSTGMTRASVSIKHATLESLAKSLNKAIFNSPQQALSKIPRITPKYFTRHFIVEQLSRREITGAWWLPGPSIIRGLNWRGTLEPSKLLHT